MVEIVLWTTPRLNFDKAGNVLYEEPDSKFIHNYGVSIKHIAFTDSNFLLEFAFQTIEAKVRPQCHVILLDSRDVVLAPIDLLQKLSACLIAFTITHPMKYLIFYDLANHKTINEINQITLLTHFIESQSINLNYYVSATRHSGGSLAAQIREDGHMDILGMKILTKAIIHQVNSIFRYRNV